MTQWIKWSAGLAMVAAMVSFLACSKTPEEKAKEAREETHEKAMENMPARCREFSETLQKMEKCLLKDTDLADEMKTALRAQVSEMRTNWEMTFSEMSDDSGSTMMMEGLCAQMMKSMDASKRKVDCE